MNKALIISELLNIPESEAEAIIKIAEAMSEYPDDIGHAALKLAGKVDKLRYYQEDREAHHPWPKGGVIAKPTALPRHEIKVAYDPKSEKRSKYCDALGRLKPGCGMEDDPIRPGALRPINALTPPRMFNSDEYLRAVTSMGNPPPPEGSVTINGKSVDEFLRDGFEIKAPSKEELKKAGFR